MTVERMIRIVAGSFILLSLYLAFRYNDVPLFDGPTCCSPASPAGA